MDIKLACADFAFPLLEHDKVLALISMLGFKGVDIGLFEGRSHLQPSSIFKDTKKYAQELLKKLEDNNLKPADVFLQTANDFITVAANHPDPKIRKKARKMFHDTLDFSKILGGTHVTSLPGVYFTEESPDASYGRACEEIQYRCEKAQEYGITFSIEPHIGSIVPEPKAAEKFVRDVPGLTLSLDYTHFTKDGIPDEGIEPLIKYATHFHARGAAKGYLQASFKHNTIDYYRVLTVMQDIGYNGYLGIEYIWIDWENCNEVDNLSEVILLRNFLLEKANNL